MKYIITEGQYKLLLEDLNEKPKVYTDKKKYDVAVKEYNDLLKIYEQNEALLKKAWTIDWYYLGENEKNNPQWNAQDSKMRAIENENQKLKSLSNKIPSGKKVKWVVCKISHLIKNNEKKGTILPKKLTMMKDSEYWSEFYRGKNMEMYAEYGFEKMEKPTKPIFKKMEIKPSQKTTEKPTTNMSSKPTNQIVQTNTQNKSVKPQINIPTQFSVSWREELPSGKVEQNTHYFPSYEEWEKFVNSNQWYKGKNENASRTKAEALYSGKLNLSKDKTN